MAADLAVPFGHDSGLKEYINQLSLDPTDGNDAIEVDLSPRMSELPNPFRLPMFPTDHRRAADTRFFRQRSLLTTAWAAVLLRAQRPFDQSRRLPPVPEWEPFTELWVATLLVVSYRADSLRNDDSSVWPVAYSEYYCNLVSARVHTLRVDKKFVRLDATVFPYFDTLDTSILTYAPDSEVAYTMYGNMRRAVGDVPWAVVLKDVARRDAESVHALQVRVMVYATKEYCVRLRHPYVDFDWAQNQEAPLPLEQFTSTHAGDVVSWSSDYLPRG